MQTQVKTKICKQCGREFRPYTSLVQFCSKACYYEHIEKVQRLHEEDLSQGFGEDFLPTALSRKYPHAAREFRWQYVFPSKNLSVDPRSEASRRHHVLESGLQKAVKTAVDPLASPSA